MYANTVYMKKCLYCSRKIYYREYRLSCFSVISPAARGNVNFLVYYLYYKRIHYFVIYLHDDHVAKDPSCSYLIII